MKLGKLGSIFFICSALFLIRSVLFLIQVLQIGENLVQCFLFGRDWSNTYCGSNSTRVNPSASSSIKSISKNAPGNRSDIGWKHGININGNGRNVKCNYCSKAVSGGIFRFKHHLVGTWKDFKPCAYVSEEIKNLMIKTVAS